MVINNPLAELIMRFLYYRTGFGRLLNSVRKSTLLKSNRERPKIGLEELRELFQRNGICKGKSVMVHTAFSRVEANAAEFVDFLQESVGSEGNVCMPSHPILDYRSGRKIYDILLSRSSVGYLTEFFRNQPQVFRSLHPFSSLAVWGKEKDYLLEGNLNDEWPLPHGKNSGYYRFSQIGGIVVCIGVTARSNATIRHVAEEVVDENLPIRDLFVSDIVDVYEKGSFLCEAKVRHLNLRKSQLYVAKGKTVKEWIDNGILRRYIVKGIPVEFIDAKKCVSYMISQINLGNTPFPFAPKKK